MTNWVTAHASTIGAAHLRTNSPCQDACAVKVSSDGQWVAIVVSDGAGTAARSNDGATHVVNFFSTELLALSKELDQRPPGQWINDFVIAKVLETREALRLAANSDDIKDFNCTLVACLLGTSGGFSIHIGDGAIVGGSKTTSPSTGSWLCLSPPENGEYANETFFITEGDWVKHLRITPMPVLDWLICCTDGGSAIALISDKEPKFGFLRPVMLDVFAGPDPESRNRKLAGYLTNPHADRVTGDDKTVVIAVRADKLPISTEFFGAPISSNGPALTGTRDDAAFTSERTVPTAVVAKNNSPLNKRNNKKSRRRRIVITGISVFVIFVISLTGWWLSTRFMSVYTGIRSSAPSKITAPFTEDSRNEHGPRQQEESSDALLKKQQKPDS